MYNIPDTHDHPKLIQEDINHSNRSINGNKIEASIVTPKAEMSRT
jgi:hypothetical protein